jgi:hypothetical protein
VPLITSRWTTYIEGLHDLEMKWAGHIARVEEMRRVLKIKVGNPKGKISLGRHGH